MSLNPYRHDAFGRAFDGLNWFDRSLFPYFPSFPERALNTGEVLGEVTNTKEKFAVDIDVHQFKPEEIKVNVTGHQLSVEGHHEERTDDHGSIQRSFVRTYTLPDDVNVDGLRSSVTADGKLAIEAPKKAIKGPQARAIPIAHSKH